MISTALIEDQSGTNKLIKLSRCGLVRAGLFLELLVFAGRFDLITLLGRTRQCQWLG